MYVYKCIVVTLKNKYVLVRPTRTMRMNFYSCKTFYLCKHFLFMQAHTYTHTRAVMVTAILAATSLAMTEKHTHTVHVCTVH